jgi:hypothetical protein
LSEKTRAKESPGESTGEAGAHGQQLFGEPSVVRIFLACLAVDLLVGLYALVTGLDAKRPAKAAIINFLST